MESDREQLEYGRYCMHGTNVGTPGGADFMCGLCESDYVYWDDSPDVFASVFWVNVETGVVHEQISLAGYKGVEDVERFNRTTHSKFLAGEALAWPFMLMWCERVGPHGWTNDPEKGVYGGAGER